MMNQTQTPETNAQRCIRIFKAAAERQEKDAESFNAMANAQGASGPMYAVDRQFQGYAEGKAAALREAIELIERFEGAQ